MILPEVLLPTVLFYVFSGLMIVSALLVITSKHPVHSVLFLIFSFFNSAGLFVLLGAEFIAMLMIIVYVGAVAVLFLFVVMMLDVDFSALRSSFIKHLPLGIVIALIMLAELVMVVLHSVQGEHAIAVASSPIPNEISNTKSLGLILYTNYAFAFQVSGLILLVAMVGAIVLTLRTRPGVLKQNISKQVSRSPEDCVEVVNVQSGKGI